MDQKTKTEVCKLIDEKFRGLEEKFMKINDIEKSVSFLSNSYDELRKIVETTELQCKSNDVQITRMTCYLNNVTNELDQVKQDLDNLEQYIRRECLEIRGVPIAKDEDTNDIVKKVGNLVNVNIDNEDISVSHRLPSKNEKNNNQDPSVIVRFVRRDLRDALYKARTKLRFKTTHDLGITRHSPEKIFITESLTRRNKDLLSRCLQKKKDLNFKFLWTKYGRILMRKDGSSPVIAISTVKDIEKLS